MDDTGLAVQTHAHTWLSHADVVNLFFVLECDFICAEFAQGELFEILEDDQALPEEVVQVRATRTTTRLNKSM